MDVLPHFIGSIEGDIIVDTTIDPAMQQAAETALRNALKEKPPEIRRHARRDRHARYRRRRQGAGRGARTTRRASITARSMPSASPARPSSRSSIWRPLKNGLTPQTIRHDRPVTIGGWSPQNYTKEHYGPVTLTRALSMSLNTVAAQLAHEVGAGTVINTAKRLGISSDLNKNLSIALGTSEVTPLEIASAYVPFSNGGYGVLPHIIRRIKTVDGKLLYSRSGDGRGRVVDRQMVGNMNVMMSETLLTGTGRKARLDGGRPAGGKTGTSQDFRDAWFIGYTANLTTAVWFGNDDNSPTQRASGQRPAGRGVERSDGRRPQGHARRRPSRGAEHSGDRRRTAQARADRDRRIRQRTHSSGADWRWWWRRRTPRPAQSAPQPVRWRLSLAQGPYHRACMRNDRRARSNRNRAAAGRFP
ncbi:penicillin-binding transpeptidase domain-containing protein [Roseibium salinum]|nr:penicillin-binding transpeptidase domain-containing protein [Roseibium salinum]